MNKLFLAVGGVVTMVLASAAPIFADELQPANPAPAIVSADALPDVFGYYVTREGNQIQVRTTDPDGMSSLYTGRITTDGVISAANLIQPESDDWYNADDHDLNFHFMTYSQVDGVNFTVQGGTEVTFWLERDGHLAATDHIFIGALRRNPISNPFVLLP
jgi:hypothetical protein